MNFDRSISLRKAELVGLLERICEALEPSSTQLERAKSSYEAVGTWIADADDDWLRSSSIYLQGSAALGTMNKPVGRNEFDVDPVCHLPGLRPWFPPALCKQLVGDRLKANSRYAAILEEKLRCWRLNYANEFHLDITPSIPNPACAAGGELVPDKTLKIWMATNPRGYRAAFERRANLIPHMRLTKTFTTDHASADADIEPFPVVIRFKGILRRAVQITKRHRDVHCADMNPALIPISVIITTLAAWSYEYCVGAFVYDNELDLLCDIVRHMPRFIETRYVNGRLQWFIWNETTEGENFAEKWNRDPRRAQAFFDWHQATVADLGQLAQLEGLDRLSKSLGHSFGEGPVSSVLNEMSMEVSDARMAGRLFVAPAVGVTAVPTRRSTPVRSNTFYGAP
jgi:hypothetical protein